MEPPDIPPPPPGPASAGFASFLYMIGCAVLVASCGFAAALFIWAIKHA